MNFSKTKVVKLLDILNKRLPKLKASRAKILKDMEALDRVEYCLSKEYLHIECEVGNSNEWNDMLDDVDDELIDISETVSDLNEKFNDLDDVIADIEEAYRSAIEELKIAVDASKIS
jgi:septation ring formation regulator EzrA